MQVFTSFIVLGLCLTAFIVTDLRGYRERKTNSMISLANVIASNSISAIVFLYNDAAKETLADLNKTPEVLHASILDKEGKVFAAYSKEGSDNFFRFHPKPNKKFEFINNQLYVYTSIINDNEVIGTICLQVELSELNKIIKQKYQIAVVLLLVGIGIAFLIAVTVQRYITTRLLYLVNIMNQVSKTGDYSRHVIVDGKDEITTLSFVFNNLLDQIQESHKKKDDFIGIASHELKTPLTSIKAYMQILNEIETKQPNKQYIQKVLENLHKLQQLLFDLLDVSKIQSGQLELNISEINIDTLIDETIASYQIVSQNHKIIRQGQQLNEIIFADRQRIEQVLINLLSNATKYSPTAHEVIITTTKNNKDLTVSVQDFGIGIPKEEHLKIFERFYRRKELDTHTSGFGLGLYICRDIIKRHNGKIWVESKEDGSVFYFMLPLKSSFTKNSKAANEEARFAKI
jgi:signal transduction histidine kinase